LSGEAKAFLPPRIEDANISDVFRACKALIEQKALIDDCLNGLGVFTSSYLLLL
jgi:hypothetical protein